MPAILVLFESGQPLSLVPAHRFQVIFVTHTWLFDKDKSEEEALKVAGAYMEQLLEKPDFEDTDTRYALINPEQSTLVTALNDHSYTILVVPVAIQAERV